MDIGRKIRLTTEVKTSSGAIVPVGSIGVCAGQEKNHQGFWAAFFVHEKDTAPTTLIVFPSECEVIK